MLRRSFIGWLAGIGLWPAWGSRQSADEAPHAATAAELPIDYLQQPVTQVEFMAHARTNDALLCIWISKRVMRDMAAELRHLDPYPETDRYIVAALRLPEKYKTAKPLTVQVVSDLLDGHANVHKLKH
jgi:hypothetical protein